MGAVFAIIGDIHANVDALRAVIDDARSCGVTDFLCVGDVVGYNSSPAECVRIVRDELNCPTVCGNHDYYASGTRDLNDFTPLAEQVLLWTRNQLDSKAAEWLSSLPLQRTIRGVTLVHSTLDNPQHWGYVFDKFYAESNFNYQKTQICFHGHTHVPVIFEKTPTGIETTSPAETPVKAALGHRLFVNVGSVGQPRDGDWRSSYVIYNTQERTLAFRRVEYDVNAAVDRNRKAGLPERLCTRLLEGR